MKLEIFVSGLLAGFTLGRPLDQINEDELLRLSRADRPVAAARRQHSIQKQRRQLFATRPPTQGASILQGLSGLFLPSQANPAPMQPAQGDWAASAQAQATQRPGSKIMQGLSGLFLPGQVNPAPAVLNDGSNWAASVQLQQPQTTQRPGAQILQGLASFLLPPSPNPTPFNPAPFSPAPFNPAPFRPEPMTPAPIPEPQYPAPVSPASMYPDPGQSSPEPMYPALMAPEPNYPTTMAPQPNYPAPMAPQPMYPGQMAPEPMYPAPMAPQPNYPAPMAPEPNYPAPMAPEPMYPAPANPAPMQGNDAGMYAPAQPQTGGLNSGAFVPEPVAAAAAAAPIPTHVSSVAGGSTGSPRAAPALTLGTWTPLSPSPLSFSAWSPSVQPAQPAQATPELSFSVWSPSTTQTAQPAQPAQTTTESSSTSSTTARAPASSPVSSTTARATASSPVSSTTARATASNPVSSTPARATGSSPASPTAARATGASPTSSAKANSTPSIASSTSSSSSHPTSAASTSESTSSSMSTTPPKITPKAPQAPKMPKNGGGMPKFGKGPPVPKGTSSRTASSSSRTASSSSRTAASSRTATSSRAGTTPSRTGLAPKGSSNPWASAAASAAASGSAGSADTLGSAAAAHWDRHAKTHSFQIILSGTPDIKPNAVSVTPNVDVYDVDLFMTEKSTISTLKRLNKTVICYFSGGTYEPGRPDSRNFPSADMGLRLLEWPSEKWLKLNSTAIRRIMADRIKLAAEKGCDAIDPDNVDGYQARGSGGLGLKKSDSINFVRFMADTAGKYGMGTGLKNAMDMINDIRPYIHFAVNEQCADKRECKMYAQFRKPVFHIEYPRSDREMRAGVNAATRLRFCVDSDASIASFFHTVIKPKALDGTVQYCDGKLWKTPTKEGQGGRSRSGYYESQEPVAEHHSPKEWQQDPELIALQEQLAKQDGYPFAPGQGSETEISDADLLKSYDRGPNEDFLTGDEASEHDQSIKAQS